MTRQRTITLTRHPPVRITEAEWPLVAQSDWQDSERENGSGKALIRVRCHADGRTLVYGVYSHVNDAPTERPVTLRAGSLLAAGDDVASAVRATVEDLRLYEVLSARLQPDWKMLADECIAALPAVVI